jgi:anti-sigma-K factor RskA
MSGHDEKYLDWAAAYVLGALDGDELREFADHLKSGCPTCAAEVILLTDTAALLPKALEQINPPAELRENILQAVHLSARSRERVDNRLQRLSSQTVPQSPKRSWLTWGLSLAVLVMVVGFSISYYALMNTLGMRNVIIQGQLTTINELHNELERKNEILKVLESRRIEVVSMDGLKVNPVGYGKIIWDPDRKIAILQVSNLPKVPKDKDYQLWMIRQKDPTPVSAGVFAVENEQEMEHFFKVQPLDVVDRNEIGAFAITLEPKGGVPQPTGDMYLLGKTSAD